MIYYGDAKEFFRKIYRNPFKIIAWLKGNKDKQIKPIQWSFDEKDSLEFAMNVAYFELFKKSKYENVTDLQVKSRIIGSICDEARKLLKRREYVKKTISYEYDIDANLADANSQDAFEEIESRVTLKQICQEIQKPTQNLFDALIAFSKNKNIQFKKFGMGRTVFFELKKIAHEKFLKE